MREGTNSRCHGCPGRPRKMSINPSLVNRCTEEVCARPSGPLFKRVLWKRFAVHDLLIVRDSTEVVDGFKIVVHRTSAPIVHWGIQTARRHTQILAKASGVNQPRQNGLWSSRVNSTKIAEVSWQRACVGLQRGCGMVIQLVILHIFWWLPAFVRQQGPWLLILGAFDEVVVLRERPLINSEWKKATLPYTIKRKVGIQLYQPNLLMVQVQSTEIETLCYDAQVPHSELLLRKRPCQSSSCSIVNKQPSWWLRCRVKPTCSQPTQWQVIFLVYARSNLKQKHLKTSDVECLSGRHYEKSLSILIKLC